MAMASRYELYKEATERVKEIIKVMNGLSEEGFLQKYHNDPAFHKGFDVLVEVFMQAKFDAQFE
jgi:hypothetical protein